MLNIGLLSHLGHCFSYNWEGGVWRQYYSLDLKNYHYDVANILVHLHLEIHDNNTSI